MLTMIITVAGILAVLLLFFVYSCCVAASRADGEADRLRKERPWPKWNQSA